MNLGRLALTLLVPALLAGCAGAPWSEATPNEVLVPVELGALELIVPARGELEATEAKPIAVPRVPTGALKVKQVVDEGAIVSPGEIVVVFDDTNLNIELDNHRASFRSADRRIDRTQLQSDIELGAIEVQRQVAELERDNVAAFEMADATIYSRREILEDEVRLDIAEETIVFADASVLLRGEYYDIEERILDVERKQVQGKIQRVEYSLGQLVLKAPLGGLVVYRKNWRGAAVGVGDSLWPGNVIMSIVDPGSTALKSYVLERDAAGLAVGAPAEIRIDARSDRVFQGEVTQIAEVSRPIERGSPVKYTEVQVTLTDGDPTVLKPGMKGEARIRAGRVESAVIIPRAALRGEAEELYVLIKEGEGARRQPVRLGPGGIVRVSIEEGLVGGESLLLGDAPPESDALARTDRAPADEG